MGFGGCALDIGCKGSVAEVVVYPGESCGQVTQNKSHTEAADDGK